MHFDSLEVYVRDMGKRLKIYNNKYILHMDKHGNNPPPPNIVISSCK